MVSEDYKDANWHKYIDVRKTVAGLKWDVMGAQETLDCKEIVDIFFASGLITSDDLYFIKKHSSYRV